MPSRGDNDAERLARIEALMEEYRVKHEDWEAYVVEARERVERARGTSAGDLETAREGAKTRKP